MIRKKLKIFSKKELRWDLYPMFLNLMKKGFEIEAMLLMLSTWNFARFRYAVRSFNLDRFRKVVKNLEPLFKKFKNQNFKTIDFEKYEADIKKIFKSLSAIKGIEKTGTPKLMHLKAPRVFVMWDYYIRKYYGFKKGDAEDYVLFLKLMQEKFHNGKTQSGRTLAKLIDEHNYKTITMLALRNNKKKLSKKSKI